MTSKRERRMTKRAYRKLEKALDLRSRWEDTVEEAIKAFDEARMSPEADALRASTHERTNEFGLFAVVLEISNAYLTGLPTDLDVKDYQDFLQTAIN